MVAIPTNAGNNRVMKTLLPSQPIIFEMTGSNGGISINPNPK